MKLVTPYPWREITRLVRQAKKERRRCYVAVPYCSKGARELLPLGPGDVLVVNMTESTARGGQTDPKEIIKFLGDGLRVDTVSDLHAKVYVLGRHAIVGSANASSSSDGLREAVAVSTEPSFVRQCREFVESLRAEEVELEHARALAKLYRPPKGVGSRRRSRDAPTHSPLWLVPVVEDSWELADYEHDREFRPAAELKVDPTLEKLDHFAWSGRPLWERLKEGDLVIQVFKAGLTTYFYPPAHVVVIERYRAKRNAKRMLVYLAAPRRKHKRSRAQLRGKLGMYDAHLAQLKNARLVRNRSASHEILRVWTK